MSCLLDFEHGVVLQIHCHCSSCLQGMRTDFHLLKMRVTKTNCWDGIFDNFPNISALYMLPCMAMMVHLWRHISVFLLKIHLAPCLVLSISMPSLHNIDFFWLIHDGIEFGLCSPFFWLSMVKHTKLTSWLCCASCSGMIWHSWMNNFISQSQNCCVRLTPLPWCIYSPTRSRK